MAPYATAPAPEKEDTKPATEERTRTVRLGEPPEWLRPAPQGPTRRKGPAAPIAGGIREGGVRPGHAPLAESLLEMSSTRPGRRTIDFLASVFLHGLLLTALLLVPLFFTQTIDLRQFVQTLLVAPPPPPPPPPPAGVIVKVRAAPKRVFIMAGKLLAPTAIPKQIAMIKEEALPPDLGVSVVGGVPGGVPGGQIGGVLGAILSGAGRTSLPPAPMPKAPVRVGGRVKMPRMIANPPPVYPPLARQAKIEGDVLIDAVIDVAGSVAEMRVVSGHPLLIPAALGALAKWKYEPTYLNDEPVPVQLLVTIHFRLAS